MQITYLMIFPNAPLRVSVIGLDGTEQQACGVAWAVRGDSVSVTLPSHGEGIRPALVALIKEHHEKGFCGKF